MKSLAIAIAIAIPFLFATLFLSFTLAACGTQDTPICSSIFGMNNNTCDKDPLEHHTAIAKQPTLCTRDALASALALFFTVVVATVLTATLIVGIKRIHSTVNENILTFFRVMNPFDPLRFAFIRGTIQQKRDVRVA